MARFTDSNQDYVLDGIATPDTDNAAANKAYVDNATSHANLTGILGDIDAWQDSEYVIRDNISGISIGQIKFLQFNAISNTTSLQYNTGLINRIIVYPFAGLHTTLFADMQAGSPFKVSSGSVELLATVGSISVNAGVYTIAFSTPQRLYSTNTNFDTEGEVTFQFRPALESPVIRGDIEPNTVIAQHINGGELSPYHMDLESTATPNPRAAGYVPVSAGPLIDAGWRWQQFDALGSADAVRESLDQFEEQVHEGIGAIPVEEDSDLRRPRQFTSISFDTEGSSDGRVTRMILGTLDSDDESWSAIDDYSDLFYPAAGLADWHMQMSFVRTDTDLGDQLYDLDVVVESSEPSSHLLINFNSTANQLTVFIDTDTSSAFYANNRIIATDGQGDVTNTSLRDITGGNGYFRHSFAYSSLGERAPLDEEFAQIGEPLYNYFTRYNTVIPVIIDNDDNRTPHVRLAGFGNGLSYDTEHNQIYVSDTEHTDVLRWDTTITNNSARLVPDGNTSNGAIFQRTDTIAWGLPDVSDDTTIHADVREGSIDSEHLATDSVDTRIIADNMVTPVKLFSTAGTAGATTFYRGDGQWAVPAGGNAESDSDIASVTNSLHGDGGNLLRTTLRTVGGRDIASADLSLPSGGGGVTYNVFDTDSDGLAPAARNIDSEDLRQHSLRADGRWIELPGQEEIFTANTAGLVPPPGQANEALFLTAAGHWRHTEEFVDSDIIIRALETLVSDWDSDTHSIELGSVVHVPATPGTAASNGSFAQYVITFGQDGSDNILHDGATMRFTCPRRQTNSNRNYDTETDYVDVAMTNPNISGFAYPPVNARGVRDIFYAILDPTTHGNNPPYADWIELNTSASDAVASNNQLVIGVSTRNPSSNGYGREGSVDTDTFIRRTFQFNGGQSSDFVMSAAFYRNPDMDDSEQTGSWPTRATPGTPARDTEILILDQQIPQFGTTEQDNETYEPGLVPQPASSARNATHFLAGDGSWQPLPADETGITIQAGGNSHSDVNNIDFRDSRIVTEGLAPNVSYRVYDVFRGQYTENEEYVVGEVVWATVNNEQSLWVADTDISSAARTFDQRGVESYWFRLCL